MSCYLTPSNIMLGIKHTWTPMRSYGILDMQAVMRHAVEHYFGGGSELLNMHERLADLLLIALSVSFEDAGNCHMTTVCDSMPCGSMGIL